VDILVLNSGEPPTLLINQTPAPGHRVLLKLAGTKSNRSAIGARVTVKSGALTQIREVHGGGSYLSQNDLRLHFGLGSKRMIDVLEIAWQNREVERLKELPADFLYTLTEGQGVQQKTRLPDLPATGKVPDLPAHAR